jgi:hypothetical protein
MQYRPVGFNNNDLDVAQPNEITPMKTETLLPLITVFPRAVALAVGHLKEHLHYQYARAYPGLDEIIRLVIDEEESRAWDLSAFPHLFLPDLVEAHLAQLGLHPTETRGEGFPVSTTVQEHVLAAAC